MTIPDTKSQPEPQVGLPELPSVAAIVAKLQLIGLPYNTIESRKAARNFAEDVIADLLTYGQQREAAGYQRGLAAGMHGAWRDAAFQRAYGLSVVYPNRALEGDAITSGAKMKNTPPDVNTIRRLARELQSAKR